MIGLRMLQAPKRLPTSLTSRAFSLFTRSAPKPQPLVRNARIHAVRAAPKTNNSRAYWLAGIAGVGIIGIAAVGGMSSSTDRYGAANGGLVVDAWPQYVRSRISETFIALGLGLGMTAISATMLFRTGVPMFMATRPIVSLIVSFGAMMVTSGIVSAVDPNNKPMKYLSLFAFNTAVAFAICPIVGLGGALLMRAAAVTGGIVGSLALVAATAPSENFLWMAGPLSMGLGAVVASSIAGMFFPGVAALQAISMYGGLAIFSGFVLYDTAQIVDSAKKSPTYDAVASSTRVYMDIINIFIRIAMIMSGGSSRRK